MDNGGDELGGVDHIDHGGHAGVDNQHEQHQNLEGSLEKQHINNEEHDEAIFHREKVYNYDISFSHH